MINKLQLNDELKAHNNVLLHKDILVDGLLWFVCFQNTPSLLLHHIFTVNIFSKNVNYYLWFIAKSHKVQGHRLIFSTE